MEFSISGRELDALLHATVGWLQAEIGSEGIVLKIGKWFLRKKITIRRIAFEEEIIVLDHDSTLVDLLKSLFPLRDALERGSIRMVKKRVYLDATKALLAKAQVDDVYATFEPNQLKLRISLKVP